MADQQAALKTAPNRGFAALWRFLPMLWPKGERELKTRVVIAVLLVLAGKAIGFVGPYALKVAVDRMSAHAAFAVVAGLVLAYALARFGGVLSDNLRNAVFEKSDRTPPAGSPARSSAMSTICRFASTLSAAPARSQRSSSAAPRAST